MALEGKAPQVLRRCARKGVPIYCVLVVLLFSLLSFLQVSNGTAVVLSWFTSLVTASQLINFCVMAFSFLRFKAACEAQGLARDSLPYKGWGQPWVAWYALTGCLIMTFVGGYTVFLPGHWNVPTFLFSYTMIGFFPVLFVGWKLLKRTKWLAPHEVDLVRDLAEIEDYTRTYVHVPEQSVPFFLCFLIFSLEIDIHINITNRTLKQKQIPRYAGQTVLLDFPHRPIYPHHLS